MIEQSFIESGFSFTTAKLLPYIITILIGLILMFLVKRKMNLKNTIILTENLLELQIIHIIL